MFEDLRGRVAVVTGGARGLGFAMAQALAGQGCDIALLDRSPTVAETAEQLRARTGVGATGLAVDVTDPAAVNHAFAQLAAELGRPSVLVNAAGIAGTVDALEIDPERWRQVLDVNVSGTFFACQAFARLVIAAGGTGAIVNVSSMSAFVVNVPQKQAAYNASKAAVDHLTRSLAVEWIGRGVRVNAIAPGYFLTEMTRETVEADPATAQQWTARIPAGRMGDPPDLAGLVVFLASDASSYVVGETVTIDGGYSVA